MSWQIDYGYAHVGFTGRHLMVSPVRGEFERFRGTVTTLLYDQVDPTVAGSVQVVCTRPA
jgi:polyisoprenoid-binding protein YceI